MNNKWGEELRNFIDEIPCDMEWKFWKKESWYFYEKQGQVNQENCNWRYKEVFIKFN